jgi:hypothetical protein
MRSGAFSCSASPHFTRIVIRYAACNLGLVHLVDERTGHVLAPLLAYLREHVCLSAIHKPRRRAHSDKKAPLPQSCTLAPEVLRRLL